MTKKLKVLTALVAITAMFWTVGKAVSAHGWGERDDFKLFGAARLVTGGIAPHEVVPDLTSNCGTLPFIASPPAVICDTNSPMFVFSGVTFKPDKNPMRLDEIKTLLTDYNMNGTDCSGGSPRFVILTSANNNYVVNIGHAPYGGNCYYGWQNTGNMTDTTDPTLRWQVNLANTFCTWSTVLNGGCNAGPAHGAETVTEVFIVLDSGWIAFRGQDVLIDNFTVNKNVTNFSEENHDH